jgi:hypothetical protein
MPDEVDRRHYDGAVPASVRSARRRLVTVAAMTLGCALAPAPIAAGLPVPTDPMVVVHLAERMLTDYLADRVPTPRLVSIASGTSMTSPCPDSFGNAAQHDRSFDYCPTDNTVYIGQERLADVDRQYGPAALLSGIAHEYGHAIQAATGVPAPATAEDNIRLLGVNRLGRLRRLASGYGVRRAVSGLRVQPATLRSLCNSDTAVWGLSLDRA